MIQRDTDREGEAGGKKNNLGKEKEKELHEADRTLKFV